jgi:pheromone shutdown protein TraB
MAKNIAKQVITSKKIRNLIIVGAAHVIGLEKEFKEKYPNLKVILMNNY